MTWSVNEVAGLAEKAARGAGAPPEQAKWFGRAASVHVGAGRDAENLARALMALPGGPIMALYLAVTEAQVANDPQVILRVGAPEDLVRSYLETLPFHVETSAMGTPLTIRFDMRRPAARPPISRGTLPEFVVVHMRDLASRTLVPESDASRQAGAGAGLLDND
jgi:hypothetical protein